MLDLLNIMSIIEIVAAEYEGGLEKFREEGGQFVLVPALIPILMIGHPGLSESLRKRLDNLKEKKVSIKYVRTLNFEGMERAEVEDILKRLFDDGSFNIGCDINIAVNKLAVIFGVVQSHPAQESINSLKSLLKRIPGLVRGCVIHDGIVDWVELEKPVQSISVEAPIREKVICDDDILNLKIALETNPWALFE